MPAITLAKSAAADLDINPLGNGRSAHFLLSLSRSTMSFITFLVAEMSHATKSMKGSRGSSSRPPANSTPQYNGQNVVLIATLSKVMAR